MINSYDVRRQPRCLSKQRSETSDVFGVSTHCPDGQFWSLTEVLDCPISSNVVVVKTKRSRRTYSLLSHGCVESGTLIGPY